MHERTSTQRKATKEQGGRKDAGRESPAHKKPRKQENRTEGKERMALRAIDLASYRKYFYWMITEIKSFFSTNRHSSSFFLFSLSSNKNSSNNIPVYLFSNKIGCKELVFVCGQAYHISWTGSIPQETSQLHDGHFVCGQALSDPDPSSQTSPSALLSPSTLLKFNRTIPATITCTLFHLEHEIPDCSCVVCYRGGLSV
jgi:hypothetical protein